MHSVAAATRAVRLSRRVRLPCVRRLIYFFPSPLAQVACIRAAFAGE